MKTMIAGLNLGCRTRAIDGWVNFDCDPHPGVDLVGDVSDLSRFADNSIPEIMASHIFEHFPIPQAPAVLKEWHRVLEPGGKLYIAVPDFERAVELYGVMGLNDWIVRLLWGDQEYKTAFHYAAYDEARLSKFLADAGFVDSFRVEEFPIGDPEDCSNLRSTYDGQSVSLNLIATKGGA